MVRELKKVSVLFSLLQLIHFSGLLQRCNKWFCNYVMLQILLRSMIRILTKMLQILMYPIGSLLHFLKPFQSWSAFLKACGIVPCIGSRSNSKRTLGQISRIQSVYFAWKSVNGVKPIFKPKPVKYQSNDYLNTIGLIFESLFVTGKKGCWSGSDKARLEFFLSLVGIK